ncbi:peroxidase 36-like [Carex rostrata]
MEGSPPQMRFSRRFPLLSTISPYRMKALFAAQGLNADNVVALSGDFVTQSKLDNQYYQNVADLKGLFFSDWSLLTSGETLNLVNNFQTTPQHFEAKFAESMVKMGNIPMLPGTKGEFRKSCRAVNY